MTLLRTKVRASRDEVTVKLPVNRENNRASNPHQCRKAVPVINRKYITGNPICALAVVCRGQSPCYRNREEL